MAFGKQYYGSEAETRESVLSILKNVSPNEDNYFVSNLGKGPVATNVIQEWNTFYEARPTSVTGQIEGAETTYADLTMETRTNNRTMILEEAVRLSRTKKSISTVTREDVLTKEKARALKRLKAKMEWATINGQYASGNSGVARGMSGIDQCISTNVTVRATNTSFTETELNDIIQQSYDQVGMEYIADMVVANVVIKRRVSSFTANNTRNINASEKRLTKEVRVYDSEVGQTVMVLAHKDAPAGVGLLKVYALREDAFEYCFLVDSGEPHWEERAVDGDRTNGTYITEFTLASYAQRASVKRSGYSTTL